MVKYKKYYNHYLYPYIVQRISEMNVRDTYKPLLVDIILRRAYEYQLSEQEIVADVNTLVNCVEKIEIADIGNLRGIYSPDTRGIKLSRTIFFGNNVDYVAIYETLTHEVFHALAGKNNRCRQYFRNKQLYRFISSLTTGSTKFKSYLQSYLPKELK